MDIHTRYYNDVAILSLSGRLDSLTTPHLAQSLSEQLAAGYSRMVIDLKQVDFLGSAAIKAMLHGVQEARRLGGDVRIANAQTQIRQVLALAGVDALIRLYPNVVGATASYFPGPLTETP